LGTTHHVASFDASVASPRYEGHAKGYSYFSVVDHTVGSVHIGKGISMLEPGGHIDRHLHSYEEAFYVLEGTVVVGLGDRPYTLVAGDYGFFPVGVHHAWQNVGDEPVRWLELCAGQPLPDDDPRRDTFWTGSPLALDEPRRIDLNDVRDRYVGHWENMEKISDYLAQGGEAGLDVGCVNPGPGTYVKRLVCETLGAQLVQLIMVEFAPGVGSHAFTHDHTYEESFFLLEGEVKGTINQQTFDLRPGDAFWCGVGTQHGWENVGSTWVRWLEGQCPQPTARHSYRHTEQWRRLGEKIDREAATGTA
jgi:quercetin dioxygenase-like cupin family protein